MLTFVSYDCGWKHFDNFYGFSFLRYSMHPFLFEMLATCVPYKCFLWRLWMKRQPFKRMKTKSLITLSSFFLFSSFSFIKWFFFIENIWFQEFFSRLFLKILIYNWAITEYMLCLMVIIYLDNLEKSFLYQKKKKRNLGLFLFSVKMTDYLPWLVNWIEYWLSFDSKKYFIIYQIKALWKNIFVKR